MGMGKDCLSNLAILHIYQLILIRQYIGSGDRGGMAPPLLWNTVCKKNRDTLIEQSGSEYSNRAVTVFREAV